MVRANGVDLCYELAGDERAAAVLLIMGLGTPMFGWRGQVPAFARRYRTLAFDNRGVGRSGRPPGPYSIAAMADDALALLDAVLGPAKGPVHVCGISMGGRNAQEIAMRHPERVGALVLASTYDAPGPEHGALLERAVGLLRPPAGDDFGSFVQALALLSSLVLSNDYLARDGAELMRLYLEASPDGFSLRALDAQVRACLAHDTRARLGAIRSPTLVLTGTSDALIDPMYSRRIAAAIPGATLRAIEGGTHGLNLERPDEWNGLALDFLATHDALLGR